MLKRLISTSQCAKHQKDFWVEILFLLSPQKYDWCKDCNCWSIENCNIQGTVIILLNTYISIMISHQRRCSLVLVYLHKISVYCHKIGISWQLNWLPYCIFLTWNVVYFSHFCCSTDTSSPIGYKTVSKVVSEIVKVGVQVQVGENSCGFLNTGKCHQNELRYQ